jgi:hypothetical protein
MCRGRPIAIAAILVAALHVASPVAGGDRDGVPKGSLSEIGYERRNGYAWLGTWPRDLLEKEYPIWKQRVGR